MADGLLAGRRTLVIGASAGIGRGVAVQAIAQGAQVVAVARRRAALDELCAEAGGGTAVVADIRRPEDCVRIAEVSGGALGGLDLIVMCAGVARLRRFAHVGVDDWRTVLETNVVGVHQLLAACLPLLDRGSVVAALSSESVGEARAGLGAYSASKAALEQSMRSWRGEHPWIRFSTVVVGATFPTEFGSDFESGLLGEAMGEWSRMGQLPTELMPTAGVADALVGVLGTALAVPSVGFEHLVLRSPSPPCAPFSG